MNVNPFPFSHDLFPGSFYQSLISKSSIMLQPEFLTIQTLCHSSKSLLYCFLLASVIRQYCFLVSLEFLPHFAGNVLFYSLHSKGREDVGEKRCSFPLLGILQEFFPSKEVSFGNRRPRFACSIIGFLCFFYHASFSRSRIFCIQVHRKIP